MRCVAGKYRIQQRSNKASIARVVQGNLAVFTRFITGGTVVNNGGHRRDIVMMYFFLSAEVERRVYRAETKSLEDGRHCFLSPRTHVAKLKHVQQAMDFWWLLRGGKVQFKPLRNMASTG